MCTTAFNFLTRTCFFLVVLDPNVDLNSMSDFDWSSRVSSFPSRPHLSPGFSRMLLNNLKNLGGDKLLYCLKFFNYSLTSKVCPFTAKGKLKFSFLFTIKQWKTQRRMKIQTARIRVRRVRSGPRKVSVRRVATSCWRTANLAVTRVIKVWIAWRSFCWFSLA